jgi:hypothetical protein
MTKSLIVFGGPGIVFMMLLAILGVIMLVFWVAQLIDIVGTPLMQFGAAGRNKRAWVLIAVLLGPLGALAWYYGGRRKVRKARIPIPTDTILGVDVSPPPISPGRL